MSKKAWLYTRLSRDDDKEQNSLQNQRAIIYDYAVSKNYIIVGESYDDNMTGTNFNREGLDELTKAGHDGLIDIVLVKDFSRLGRHKTLTAMYIDEMKEIGVEIFSVTENLSSMRDEDDFVIGLMGVFNDRYAKDIIMIPMNAPVDIANQMKI